MSIGKDGSQRPVPTLTEVVQLPAEAAGAGRNPTNPVVTPTLRKMSIDDSRKTGDDAGRNRLATVLPAPTLPPVLVPGSLPVASSPIAMPSPLFAPEVPPFAAGAPAPPPSPLPPVSPVQPLSHGAAIPPPAPAESSSPVAIVAADPPVASPIDAAEESRLVERVLADLLPHIDLLLEHRLREALAPAFERVAQTLLVEARTATSQGLRDVVAASVARELERARLRNE